jgi:hypothetical protein
MRPAGKINLIAVVLIAGVFGGIWWIVNYSSAYLDNLDVHDAVKSAYNTCWRYPDGQLSFEIRNKLNASTLGWHEELDETGALKRVNGLGITEDDVHIERDEVATTIHINVTYKRKVYLWPWPGKDNVRWLNFSETAAGAIKPPNQ